MSKKKKRTPKGNPNKHYMITDARLEEIKDEMAEEATHKACMIMLGELAEMGWTEDEILDLFDRFTRHVEYANQGVLPSDRVQAIVTEKTGIHFECRWY